MMYKNFNKNVINEQGSVMMQEASLYEVKVLEPESDEDLDDLEGIKLEKLNLPECMTKDELKKEIENLIVSIITADNTKYAQHEKMNRITKCVKYLQEKFSEGDFTSYITRLRFEKEDICEKIKALKHQIEISPKSVDFYTPATLSAWCIIKKNITEALDFFSKENPNSQRKNEKGCTFINVINHNKENNKYNSPQSHS